MNIDELLDTLQKLNINITNKEISEIWGMEASSFSRKKRNKSKIAYEHIKKLEDKLNIKLTFAEVLNNESLSPALEWLNNEGQKCNMPEILKIEYYPDVYLSAGYGVEVYDENCELVIIDEKFLTSEKGMRVNPKNCKMVKVSGNSMSPDYIHGDRVIIDESDHNLTDGQIYAFRYDGQCYMKEINRAGNKIKCISVNKDYEPFFIERDVDFKVFGRILPRIRL